MAIERLRTASELMPHESSIWTSLGVAYQMSEQFAEAIEALEKAVAISPEAFDCRNSLGLTYNKMGEFGKAIRWYETAAEVLVDSASHAAEEHGFLRTYISEDGSKTLHAESDFMSFVGEWLINDGRYCVAMNNVGGVYLENGDREKAKDAFIESIQMTPPDTDYRAPFEGLRILGIEWPSG